MDPLRVAVIDDDSTVRLLLAALLGSEDRLEVVHTHADRASLLEAVGRDCPDVVVLDNQMPGGDGIDLLPELRRRCPRARLVMYSSDAGIAERALALGADAFVGKQAPLASVVAAVLAG